MTPRGHRARRTTDDLVLWPLGADDLFGWPGALHRVREVPWRLVHAVEFAARARRALARIAPERTIAHFIVPCGYPLSLGTTGELEVVLHGSDARAVCHSPRLVRAAIARALLARGASLRFASERLRREFVQAFTPATAQDLLARSRVVLPTLDLPARSSVRVRLPGAPETWVACGRLIASKRVDRVIVEAARRGARLTIVGDGPERARLHALAARLLPSTHFTGHLPHPEALAHIAACDRFVHLSDLEGAPSVVREARALGVPVLATAAGDVADWARSDAGIELFAVNDDPR
jgi:teichuronic acid biosynthesis glycosyltransferase TuaC